jgi:hypothetical protein
MQYSLLPDKSRGETRFQGKIYATVGNTGLFRQKKPRSEFEAGLNLRSLFENLPGPQLQAYCNSRNRGVSKNSPRWLAPAGGIYGDV